ncbi:uncharacterized protein PRCAT00003329001 [Priceomyces carsonii]|uniref:uncharacterized protein n=1 Tax=Priceomyces carsonii TaxID=28549 RepID=UPI002ED99B6D|nr:unnamed protein product [Priceomyces carsonii]
MTLTRPKRRATINKEYAENIDESIFEEQATSRPTSSSSTTKNRGPKRLENEARNKLPSNGATTKKTIPYNWQPPSAPIDFFSNKLDLTEAYINLKSQILYCPHQLPIPMSFGAPRRRKSKDIFHIKKGDYIYMISEPPGEPYYIGRILGFTSKVGSRNNSSTELLADEDIAEAKDYVFQIQWFYRPRDISRSTSDSRLIYASMHSDTCPLSSFRGLVTVRHKHDIENEYDKLLIKIGNKNESINNNSNGKSTNSPPSALDVYSEQPNAFYFDKLFDRYMIKFYDIILTSSLLKYADIEGNKSRNFLIALNKRFEFVFVESQRLKSFINGFSSNSCNCEKCGQWCSTQDSVSCAVCEKFYHMFCLDPPLMKKPSRGFSWSCAACTKKHDLECQKKRTLMLSHDNKSSNEKELSEERSELSSPVEISEDSESDSEISGSLLPKYELMAMEFLKNDAQLTLEERRLKEEWSMRYLGMHSRLEDGVDIEDRSPYPRASTRLGAKHQATNIPEMNDHYIVYYDDDSSKNGGKKKTPKKTGKSKAKDELDKVKLEVPEEFKETPPEDYPDWLQPRPKGYIQRGVDDGDGITCTLLWKSSEEDESDDFAKLDHYIKLCSPVAEKLKLFATSPNFMDAILKSYMDHSGDIEASLVEVSKLTRKSLREPTFSKEEIKRFEAGVKKYGSELYPVFKEVKSQPSSMVVRFYYLWKKTKNGRLIWGNFEGRAHKKVQNIVKDELLSKESKKDSMLGIDYLADAEDDSAYEGDKIIEHRKLFVCKHCHTNVSIMWFRFTGYDANTKVDGEAKNTVTGLCFRCARLWRRYAVTWEEPQEVEKKTSKSYSGWKKKIEFELIRDANSILNEADEKGAELSYEPSLNVTSSIVNISRGRKPASKTPSSASSSYTLIEKDVKVESQDKRKKPDSKLKKQSKEDQKKPSKKDHKKEAVKLEGKQANGKSSHKPSPSKPQKIRNTKVDESAKTGTVLSSLKEVSSNESKKVGRKRKRKPEELVSVKEENMVNEGQTKGITVAPKTLHKRQRKLVSLSNRIFNPLINGDYLAPDTGPTYKIDRKNLPIMTKDKMSEIVTNYRKRQLLDLTTQVQAMQIPHLLVRLPFDVNERKCSFCREHVQQETSKSEMLICSHCGVNVHSGCVGFSIPELLARPIKEWLCEACINDLKPQHSIFYSCSLCLANESNYELSILGSPLVRPDYLKPIYDSGKWCHLLCALYSYNLVDFRPIQSPSWASRRSLREEGTELRIPDAIYNAISLESVSKIYLENYSEKCGICNSYNGSLVSCDLCEKAGQKDSKFHVTCAQDTPNFKLGFKLETLSNVKDLKLTRIEKSFGKLKPIMLCPKHDQSNESIYNLRDVGARTYGNKEEQKPLISLFLEDVLKSNTIKLTGPQFKSNGYIESCKIFEEREKKSKAQNQYLRLFNLANGIVLEKPSQKKICNLCKTLSSPMWWLDNQGAGQTDVAHNLCQSCYHKRGVDENNHLEDDSEEFLDLLQEPLNGEQFGILSADDKLSDVFKPGLSKYQSMSPLNESRSHISIGDILS